MYAQSEIVGLIGHLESQNKQYNIRFILVVAMGSRLSRTNISESPIVLKGFYVGSRESYLSVVRPPKELKSEKNISIEYEFIDIKTYLRQGSFSDPSSNERSLWIHSDLIYVNQIPVEVFAEMKNQTSFPLVVIAGRLIQAAKTYPKMNELRVSAFNQVVVLVLYALDSLLHGKDPKHFPLNNVWELAEDMKKRFPDTFSQIERIEKLLKKYIKLESEKVEISTKGPEEDELIAVLVDIVEKNKPLRKKEQEILNHQNPPHILNPLARSNELFRTLFEAHSSFKSFQTIKEQQN